MNHLSGEAPRALLLVPLLALGLATIACPPKERDYGNASSSSSGMVDPEQGSNCLDGADNDSNGALDCADPGCEGAVACVGLPPIPSGWTGYYRVRTSPYPSEAPAPCPDGSTPSTYFADPAGPAECSCSCGPLVGGFCSIPPGGCDEFFNCSSSKPLPEIVSCAPVSDYFSSGGLLLLSCQLQGPPVLLEPASCSPTPVVFSNAATWGSEIHACGVATTGNGCGPGQICATAANAPAEERTCIWHTDTVSCPPGWGAPLHAYDGAGDTRSCTECECTPQMTTCEGGGYFFYSDSTCAGTPNDSVESPSCESISGSYFHGKNATPMGSCAAQGGAPTGELLTEGPSTFCCIE
jgi:hypothetical protein